MELKINGKKIVLEAELFDQPYPSSTGKSIILFTSKGFQWFKDVAVNITVIKRK